MKVALLVGKGKVHKERGCLHHAMDESLIKRVDAVEQKGVGGKKGLTQVALSAKAKAEVLEVTKIQHSVMEEGYIKRVGTEGKKGVGIKMKRALDKTDEVDHEQNINAQAAWEQKRVGEMKKREILLMVKEGQIAKEPDDVE